jgi:hypothetical protein
LHEQSAPARPRRLQRALGLAAALAAAASMAAGASAADARPRAQPLDPSRLGRQPVGAIRDRVVSDSRMALVVPKARVPSGPFEGRYPVSGGYSVRVLLSESYEPDVRVSQSVADYLSTLLHGGEIRGVTVFLGSREELDLVCGRLAEACFNAGDNTMLVPAVPPPSGISQEDILAHEYGHALANGRSNYPFPAIAFGTKRWASYERVCPRFLRVLVDPEARITYRTDPGEAFADSYRIINGGNPRLWVFDRRYFPNPVDRRLIRQDVLQPWFQRPPFRLAGSFPAGRPGISTRRLRIATPLDGILRIRLQEPPGADFEVSVQAAGQPRPPIAPARRGRFANRAEALICGQRSFGVTVRRLSGYGRFTLSVQRP